MKNQSFVDRLGYACSGLAAAWRAEQSFRMQVILAAVWFVVLLLLQASLLWWLLSALVTAMVLAAELMNTALEHLADHLAPEEYAAVEVAKDCAAAAVLMTVAAALVVAAFTLRATLLQA